MLVYGFFNTKLLFLLNLGLFSLSLTLRSRCYTNLQYFAMTRVLKQLPYYNFLIFFLRSSSFCQKIENLSAKNSTTKKKDIKKQLGSSPIIVQYQLRYTRFRNDNNTHYTHTRLTAASKKNLTRNSKYNTPQNHDLEQENSRWRLFTCRFEMIAARLQTLLLGADLRLRLLRLVCRHGPINTHTKKCLHSLA